MVKKLFSIIRMLNSDLSPSKIAVAGVIGVFWGMTPFFTPHNLLLLLVVILLKVPINFTLLSMIFTLPYSYLFSDTINALGKWVLKSDALSELFRFLYNSFWILTQFNNTFLMGGFIISLLLALPVFLITTFFIKRYRDTLKDTLSKNAFYQKILRKIKVFDFILNISKELQAQEQSSSLPSQKKHRILGWMDWKFTLPFLAAIVLFIIGFKYSLDHAVKNLIAEEGTRYNQALVELSRFTSSLTRGQVSVHDLQWTDNQNPNNNLFQFKRFTAHAQIFPLLRGRFVFDELTMRDLRLNTPRERSGRLTTKPEATASTTTTSTPTMGKKENFIDNALQDIQKDFQAQLDKLVEETKTQVIRQENEIVKQKQALIEQYQNRVSSLEKDFNFQEDILRFKRIDVSKIKDLPSALAAAEKIGGIEETFRKTENASKQVKQLKDSLSQDLQEARDELDPDRIRKDLEKRVLRILGLGSLTLDGFSARIFGPAVASPINTFLDYYQKYKHLLFKKGKETGEEPEVVYDPSIRMGQDIHYPIDNPYPRLYIRRLIGTGDPEVNGVYKIDVENLSSNPIYAPIRNAISIAYDAFRIDLNGEVFESQKTKGEIDIIQQISTQPFPLAEMIELSPNLLIQSLDKGEASVQGKIEDRGEKITFSVAMRVRDTLFKVQPGLHPEIKEVLENTLASIDELLLNITVEKREGFDPKIGVDSNLDRLLQSKFSSFFKKYAAEKQRETLRELDRVLTPTLIQASRRLEENPGKDLFKDIESDISTVTEETGNLKKKINDLQKEGQNRALDEVKKAVPKEIKKILPKKLPF